MNITKAINNMTANNIKKLEKNVSSFAIGAKQENYVFGIFNGKTGFWFCKNDNGEFLHTDVNQKEFEKLFHVSPNVKSNIKDKDNIFIGFISPNSPVDLNISFDYKDAYGSCNRWEDKITACLCDNWCNMYSAFTGEPVDHIDILRNLKDAA